MPEIAEIARACHFLRKHLAGRKIASVEALDDAKIFATAKTGLTKAKLEAALPGRTVLDARQQGKYFWLVLDKPPHLLAHFGMTGWFKFSHDESAYYRPQKERDNRDGAAGEWPPRFWKLVLKMEGPPSVEAAFVDARRFGKLLLIDAPADAMRSTSPLKDNGPDPVQDRHVVTAAWLTERLRKKRIPVKAALLDQALVSGVGNWVADEILYQARLHPEQSANTLTDAQIGALHTNLHYVCQTACDLLADSDQFPSHWLMRYRWGKGRLDDNTLPNGDKIKHITVGGRTSAIVPRVQKKTAPVAGDAAAADLVDAGADEAGNPEKAEQAGQAKTRVKRKASDAVESSSNEAHQPAPDGRRRSSRRSTAAASSTAAAATTTTDTNGTTAQSTTRKRRKA